MITNARDTPFHLNSAWYNIYTRDLLKVVCRILNDIVLILLSFSFIFTLYRVQLSALFSALLQIVLEKLLFRTEKFTAKR